MPALPTPARPRLLATPARPPSHPACCAFVCADLLKQRDHPLAKTTGLDLSFLTTFAGEAGASKARLGQEVHDNGPQLDDEILADADVQVGARAGWR